MFDTLNETEDFEKLLYIIKYADSFLKKSFNKFNFFHY